MKRDYKFKLCPDEFWFQKKSEKLPFLLDFKLHLSLKRGKIAPWFDEKLFFTDKRKNIMINKSTLLRILSVLLFVGFGSLKAQQFAELKVVVTTEDGKPFKGASVIAKQGGIERDAGTSNSDGNVYFTTLIPGVYDIIVNAEGFAQREESGRNLTTGLNNDASFILSKTKDFKIIKIQAKKSVTNLNENKNEISGDRAIITGARGIGAVSRTNAAINTANGATSVRGSRTDASGTYVDGMRAIGGGAVPSLGVQSIAVQVGGIPAQYGDLTGGAFTYTTKGVTGKFRGAAEAITSTGLDPYGYNTIEGFFSGPLWKKKYQGTNSAGKKVTKEYVKLGFTLNGNIGYFKDANPTRTGVYVVKEDKLNQLEENPLTITPQGFVHNASFLTSDDIENVKARPNSALGSGNFIGKLEYKPNNNINLTGYASYYYTSRRNNSNSLMNFNNNGRSDNQTIRSYLKFTQKFKTDPESSLKDAFYTVRAEYQNASSKGRDANHLDNVFNYGYVGKFSRYQTERYAYDNYDSRQNPNRKPTRVVDQNGNVVELTNAWYQEGFIDTLMTFQASDLNPLRAKYTQNVYDFFNERGGRITNPTVVQLSQGLLNGFNPNNVYSLWGTPGGITSGFSKSQTERYSLFALGQMKYQPKRLEGGDERTPHDLQAGLYYEQQFSRAYGLGANGLWILMNQLANNHIGELDKTSAILNYDANGVFGDTVRYNRLINYSEQSAFDRNLRNSLIADGARDVYGNEYNESSFIDVNSLDPSTFKVDYFSADELLNNGNSYVSYYGYDHLGNKVNGKPDIDAFLKDPAKRTIGAFQPVYIAAWLQDQVKFRNLVFRGGVRMERYDANQLVIKDPYSLYPVKTAGEVKDINGLNIDHPSNIGNDYKVYVNNIDNPTKVIGYRNGDNWFNADGSEQKNPEFLANQTNNGRIAPFLVNPKQDDITKETFEDFTPVINILPRLWFSFPLVPNEKSFYVSYDVLAQRPNQGASFLTIDEVFYLKNRQGRTISNGNLQPRLKTDYEIGYKQIFGSKGRNKRKNMALELAASYSEVRQDFGLYQINNGYPVTYTTYRNIDFSTITGFRAGLFVNDLGPLSVSVSYQLQFADGTGSNINSQQALIQSNQPNLRNVIPLGSLDVRHSLKTSATFAWSGGIDPYTRKKRYKGPANLEKYLEFASLNIISNAYSGLPYTPTLNPVQIGAVQRAQIKGSPFGARMPWQNTFDINITKGFLINRKTKDNPLVVSVFLWVQNVLNTKNTVGVFPYTGAALDDGFLNSPAGQLVVESQVAAQSYVDLYKTLLNSYTGNFARPRNARIGVRFNFN
ncbi:MAG: carboxypeptidase-like regulatory domain-containing protein [Bacteroidia bacterium]|nr:carboxypeptidase-like regulatory domain-containing protein [Bacteroidia bacterium]